MPLLGEEHPEQHVRAVLPWIHEAGNPYFDWFFGGSAAARCALDQLMRDEASEIAIRRACLLLDRKRAIGGFIALAGAELARARQHDTLTIVAWARADRRRLLKQIVASKGLFAPVAADDFYLSKMGLVPERRGRGLGHVLVGEYLRRGEEAGLSRFRLDVHADNAAAVSIYGTAGFEVAEVTTRQGMTYLAMVRGR